MPYNKSIPIVETPYVSKLAKDYLLGKDIGDINPGIPSLNQLLQKAAERQFSTEKRKLLVKALRLQYQKDGVELREDSKVFKNIQFLNNANTFSFTTGQQIHIFLGPLFFLYKIQSLIASVKYFNTENEKFTAVPVFWMATEDHDLEEINYVKLYGESFKWDTEAGNAVGRLLCEGLPELIDKLEERADKTAENKKLFYHFRKHYTPNKTLAAATRSLLHEIFEDEGLIIIDPDDKLLKESFLEIAKREISEKIVYETVGKNNRAIKNFGYEPRVNPQEINFFWLEKDKRLKLKMKDGIISKDNTPEFLTEEEIYQEPEKLSPNVLLRPIYQETILPNLLYLGGSAEVEYWLPLQNAFKKLNIPYPVLMQRDSQIILSEKNLEMIEKAGFSWNQLFEDEKDVANLFFEKLNEGEQQITNNIKSIETKLAELKSDFEQNKSTPGTIYKEIGELQKGLTRLVRLVSDEELRLQKENPALNKLLKIKAKFFDTKQEREEFVVAYPFIIGSKIYKSDFEAELILNDGRADNKL